jgi:hypothetical protein
LFTAAIRPKSASLLSSVALLLCCAPDGKSHATTIAEQIAVREIKPRTAPCKKIQTLRTGFEKAGLLAVPPGLPFSRL